MQKERNEGNTAGYSFIMQSPSRQDLLCRKSSPSPGLTETTVATFLHSRPEENAVALWLVSSKDLGRNYFLPPVYFTNKLGFTEAK